MPARHATASVPPRWIKVLVVAMGALVVCGTAVLVAAAVSRPEPPRDAAVVLPPGGEVRETRTGDGRIVLRVALPDGESRLIVIDAETGRQLRTVRLRPGPADGRD